MRGYDYEMSRKEMFFWMVVSFIIAGTIAGMQCGCQAVGTTTTNAPQGPQTINQGITYWNLYWSGLILLGILGVLYYLREAMKYGLNPVRILKGIRK
jgi:hypothetical protein